MTHDPVPQRLSDAERDDAATMLREHFEAGRLDAGEFDQRLTAALSAKFASDLAPLFADLPDPRPSSDALPFVPVLPRPAPAPAPAPPAAPVGSGGTDWVGVARGAIWPVAIVLAFATGNFWMFIMIAIVGSIVLGQVQGNQRKPPPYLGR